MTRSLRSFTGKGLTPETLAFMEADKIVPKKKRKLTGNYMGYTKLLANALLILLRDPSEVNKKYGWHLLDSYYSNRHPHTTDTNYNNLRTLPDPFGLGERGQYKLKPPTTGASYRYRTKGFTSPPEV